MRTNPAGSRNTSQVDLTTPTVDELGTAVQELRRWQADDAAWHLHPGDIGWFWRNGPQTTADAVRLWTRNGAVVAVGLLDGAHLLRLTTAPEVRHDRHLARRLAADISDPQIGVLPPGRASVEAPAAAALQHVLAQCGWGTDEPFTPLRRDLAQKVEDPGIRVEIVTEAESEDWAGVLRSAFGTASPTRSRWQAMASSFVYEDAACLLGYDREDAAAAVTVWSAGAGRPGLIEPMGVHENHRGRGFGRAITLAAAAALRTMGASSASVYTPSSNTGGVATYASAGFVALPSVLDRLRPPASISRQASSTNVV